jgi:glucokinase
VNREIDSQAPLPLVLVADIGGTHVRFGLADAKGPVHRETMLYCADFPHPAAAAEEYLAGLGAASRPTRAVFAVASPITGDRVEMTNQVWDFSIADTRRRLALAELRVINDFTALALSLPVLQAEDVRPVKAGHRRPGAPIALLGPGTGLGVSGLVPFGDRWVPLSTEGGHRDLAATTEREWQIVRHLQREYGHLSAERVVSGPGLVVLYRALCDLEGRAPEDLEPAEVEHRARQQADGLEAEAVGLFSGWLGAVAGDLALTLGATGGLYLAGGILPKMGPVFDDERFRQRFVAKGRFRDYLEAIPVDLVLHRTAALIGAVRALDLG